MTEKKCIATIRHKSTGETLALTVWAMHKQGARNKLQGVLTGWDGEYKIINIRMPKDENGAAIRRRKEIAP